MKKFITGILIIGLSITAIAQIAGPRRMKNAANQEQAGGDTVTSSNTLYLYTETMSGGNNLTIQVNTTKVSGTTSFNTYLEVCADAETTPNSRWNRIAPAVADTFIGTDGNNTYIWNVPKIAKRYRIAHVNASGNSWVKAYYQWW